MSSARAELPEKLSVDTVNRRKDGAEPRAHTRPSKDFEEERLIERKGPGLLSINTTTQLWIVTEKRVIIGRSSNPVMT